MDREFRRARLGRDVRPSGRGGAGAHRGFQGAGRRGQLHRWWLEDRRAYHTYCLEVIDDQLDAMDEAEEQSAESVRRQGQPRGRLRARSDGQRLESRLNGGPREGEVARTPAGKSNEQEQGASPKVGRRATEPKEKPERSSQK
jgi:hypothetical protein